MDELNNWLRQAQRIRDDARVTAFLDLGLKLSFDTLKNNTERFTFMVESLADVAVSRWISENPWPDV